VAALAQPVAARPELFEVAARDRLIWIPKIGVGYLDVPAGIDAYDKAYFDKYARYAATDLGRKLTKARIELVARHWKGPLLDIGIGCGQFVQSRPDTLGYDVNPAGIDWLTERGLWSNPWMETVQAASLWDVLEHIPDFDQLLDQIEKMVFCCLPVFAGPEQVLASKHYRPDEHCWYFTMRGFINTMRDLGWMMVETSMMETMLGRDGIASFAFQRP
jgi:hypothetical protein